MTRIDGSEVLRRIRFALALKRLNIRKNAKGKWVTFEIVTGKDVTTYDTLKQICDAYKILNQWETI